MNEEDFDMTHACIGASLLIGRLNKNKISARDMTTPKAREVLSMMDEVFATSFGHRSRSLISGVLMNVIAEQPNLSIIREVQYRDGKININ